MKRSNMTIAAAVVGLFAAVPAYGQERTSFGIRQPAPVEQTRFNYDSYYAAEEGATQEQAPAAPAPAADPAYDSNHSSCPSNGCNGGCNGCCNGCDSACEDECGPWKLFDFGECSPWIISGFVDQGFTWNPDSPTDRFNAPLVFNDRANEYQLNQVYLYAERTTNTDYNWFDVGGRVDLLYGTDWRFTPAAGLEVNQDGTDRWNVGQRFYGLAMPQLYAEFAVSDVKFKVGRWYTIAGYEVVPATGNFFYSHAMTHQYFEPFTHTGILGSWAMSDAVTFYGGIDRGWDQWENNNAGDNPSFIGGVTLTGDIFTLAWAFTAGNEAALGSVPTTQSRYYNSWVLTTNVTENFKWVLEHDYGFQDDAVSDGNGGVQDAEWYSVTNYFFYTINCKWAAGLRAEWSRDDDGFRVATLGPPKGPGRGPGFAGNFYEVTCGLHYQANANILFRPEVRWDWYDGEDGVGGRPFDDGTDSSLFTMGVDAIVTY